jgi:serine/threonine-protein kinase HipA
MPPRARDLSVWANGIRIGHWRWPTNRPMEFQYDPEWLTAPEARPLSLSLPLRFEDVPHKGKAVEAYFDNLLPDSDSVRRRIQDRFRTSSRNAFDLLAAIGRDCVGAVQILPADESPQDIHKISAQSLSEAEIARDLTAVTSPTPRSLGSDEEFKISLAGAQEKTAFLFHRGKWCRPSGSTPTTHIFKLPLGLVGNMRADMRESVENEWLCARIAAAFGIPVAACEIEKFGEHTVLVVERFDRQLHSSGKYWLRLMQEDFCQASGVPHTMKYQSDGGPGLRAIAKILLQSSSDSEDDLRTLFRAQLLFWMLAATDGHAKNFSIRLLPQDRYQLTPLYDVLSAWPVIGRRASEIPLQKAKLAMGVPFAKPHYLLARIQRRHFETLAENLGFRSAGAELMDEMIAKTPAVIEGAQKKLPRGFPQSLLDRVLGGLGKAAQSLERV